MWMTTLIFERQIELWVSNLRPRVREGAQRELDPLFWMTTLIFVFFSHFLPLSCVLYQISTLRQVLLLKSSWRYWVLKPHVHILFSVRVTDHWRSPLWLCIILAHRCCAMFRSSLAPSLCSTLSTRTNLIYRRLDWTHPSIAFQRTYTWS